MNTKIYKTAMAVGLILIISACGILAQDKAEEITDQDHEQLLYIENWEGSFPSPDLPVVSIYIEGHGEIIAELYPEFAPITVHNFIELVEEGFYDGLTFHRIISGFMMQGGCPEGTGTGGSGNTITGEFEDNGFYNPLKHERGILSMARTGYFNSASSQFFIIDGVASHLDNGFAAVGRVIHGLNIVDSVVAGVTPIDRNGTVSAEERPVIRHIKLINGSQIELDQ